MIRLGLRANWLQFALLVLINAFVGAMVGLERAVLPLLGEQDFGLASQASLLAFVASFGATKALVTRPRWRVPTRSTIQASSRLQPHPRGKYTHVVTSVTSPFWRAATWP